jgi:hypothetical protein
VTPFAIRCSLAAGVLSCAALLAGCEAEKSRNPLSPSVAGPLPGVTITAPKALEPLSGSEIVSTSQPVRLLLENASSNSVRPYWFELQIARDAGFTSVVHVAERITPGQNGRTVYQVPITLASDQTYFWRSRALDGANTGPFSAAASFQVVVPIEIDAPVLLSPARGEVITGIRPRLVAQNGRVSGPAGQVHYSFEIAVDAAMTHVVALNAVPMGSNGQTVLDIVDLGWSTEFYWRVRGFSAKTTGPYSAVSSFRTPAAPVAPTPAPPATPTPPVTPAPTGPTPTPGYRAPDPAPGQRLPLPDMFWVVEQVARSYPNALRNSCQDHGGSWEFMDRVVDELRRHDLRWSYNAKRGNFNDPSHDVVFYHWGAGASERSRDGYVIDIIVSHCGSNPQPSWLDQTAATFQGGTTGGYMYPRPGR